LIRRFAISSVTPLGRFWVLGAPPPLSVMLSDANGALGPAGPVGPWPFELDVIAKTKATTRFKDARDWHERHRIAKEEIRPALEVLRPELVDGRRVLVFDDVFTDGLTLREVARALRGKGAVQVSEIVLARQPFRA
jgi:phosphoribosyl transferase-like protein